MLKLAAGTAGAAAAGWLWSAPAAEASPSPHLATGSSNAGPLDAVVFGDAASESAHGLTTTFSDIVTGGLNQPARVLNPADGFWGGTVGATLACKPKGPTYVTVKLWGSDVDDLLGNRLQLFVDGKQVGHYHLGAVDPLDIASDEARSPGRFYLHTLPLPEEVTAGKESVALEIRSMAPIAGYAQTATQYYKSMQKPTRGIYRLYTHSDPYFSLDDGDVTGTLPVAPVRPSPGREVLDLVMAKVVAQANAEASRTGPQLDVWFLEFLGRAFKMPATKAYGNPAVPGQVASSLDAIYWRSRTDPKIIRDSNQQWMGLGRLGLVLLQLEKDIKPLFDEPIAGSPGVISNPGFELGGTMPSGWRQATWAGSGTASRDTAVFRSGTAAGKITVPTTGVVGLVTNARIPVGTGTYTYATWVKTDGVKAGGAYLDVLFFDAANKLVGGDHKYYAAAGTNDWHPVSASLATPANATQVEIQVRLDGAGTAWFDDLTLQAPAGSALAPILRRNAWATMLLESREYWRQNFPQYTNQAMICAIGLYLADRGLSLLGSADAWGETRARGYIYQSVGLSPWLGPEKADGTPTKPLGGSYFQVSRKGISKELGYAGNYGELQDWISLIFDAVIGIGGIDDQKLRQHLITMAKARMIFRHPAVDSDGYKSARYEAIVGWRDSEYPGRVAYDEGNKWDGHPLKVVSLLKDPELTAYARQSLEDNQFFHILQEGYDMGLQARTYLHFLSAADDYAYVSGAPASSVRLPMMPGQPDFIFSDEENGLLALKNGDEILFASLYWRARWGINRLARLHHISSNGVERSGTVWQNVQFVPDGRTHTEPNWVNWEFGNADMPGIPGGGFAPPGPALQQVFAGQPLPLAASPSDVPVMPVGKESPFAGRAAFYQCEYGPFLIAMNSSADRTYSFTPSAGFGVSVNLATGEMVQQSKELKVAPGTTVVLRRQ
ncbi:hypothetical protein [Arthrobacter sp. HS15c]|uniref:hypothetical protein n=1 Tax=Arthrobacter sp. HS15c TaxID=3230279 RepID=UPI003467D4C5